MAGLGLPLGTRAGGGGIDVASCEGCRISGAVLGGLAAVAGAARGGGAGTGVFSVLTAGCTAGDADAGFGAASFWAG